MSTTYDLVSAANEAVSLIKTLDESLDKSFEVRLQLRNALSVIHDNVYVDANAYIRVADDPGHPGPQDLLLTKFIEGVLRS